MKVYLWSSYEVTYWEELMNRAGVVSRLVSYAKERVLKQPIAQIRKAREAKGKKGSAS